MTFRTWLKKQTDRNDLVGDLAGDIERDTECPRKVGAIRRHIARSGCVEALEALDDAWIEYRVHRRNQKLRTEKRETVAPVTSP